MRIFNFAGRNFKEIIRDPLSIIFALLLPLFLLFIFQQFKIPNEVYRIENFTPGIIIFSFAFITLFTATLVAKDRTSSLLARLAVSPMKASEYVCGYTLSVLPIILLQDILFFTAAVILGLDFSVNIIYTALATLPISVLFIALGILIGCITTERAASGISSVIVQLVVFTGGMYFSADMIGDFFAVLCDILPFGGCVNITKGILNSNYENILQDSLTVLIYTVTIMLLSAAAFKRKSIGNRA